MKKLVLSLTAAVSLTACGQSENETQERTALEFPNQPTYEHVQERTALEFPNRPTYEHVEVASVLPYDMGRFLGHFSEMAGDPGDFAEEVMREHGLRLEQYGFRDEQIVLREVIEQAQDTLHRHVLGESPSGTLYTNSRFDFDGYNLARRSFDTAARRILSNPPMVRLIGDRVANHVHTASVSQELFLMLRTARPALETEFRLLPGVNDAWWGRYQFQDEEFQDLPGTSSMRSVCGDDLPRDCVDAWYFLIRRYNDGGVENVAAWQYVGQRVLDALEERPEFRGL